MGTKIKYVIKDWAGNEMFDGKTFREFDDAWDYLYGMLEQRVGIPQNEEQENQFETELGEFQVVEKD